MDTKLILFEGIPGSGKSTMAHKTALILNKKKIPHCLYREGCLHPANLDGYAVMSAAEFEKLIKQFPQHEGRVRGHSLQMEEPNIEEEGHTMEMGRHILVQRQKDYRSGSPIFRYLEPYAVWDNGLDFDLFAKLHRWRWSEFSQNTLKKNETAIFECAFLQDHITELMLFYEKPEAEIIEYFLKLEECISALNPFLIYLQQDCVEETIGRISRQRIHEPDGRPWAERVAEMVAESPYGKANALTGYEGMVEFFKRRKEMDLKVLGCLNMKHISMNNSDYDWKGMQGRVLQVISSMF